MAHLLEQRATKLLRKTIDSAERSLKKGAVERAKAAHRMRRQARQVGDDTLGEWCEIEKPPISRLPRSPRDRTPLGGEAAALATTVVGLGPRPPPPSSTLIRRVGSFACSRGGTAVVSEQGRLFAWGEIAQAKTVAQVDAEDANLAKAKAEAEAKAAEVAAKAKADADSAWLKGDSGSTQDVIDQANAKAVEEAKVRRAVTPHPDPGLLKYMRFI